MVKSLRGDRVRREVPMRHRKVIRQALILLGGCGLLALVGPRFAAAVPAPGTFALVVSDNPDNLNPYLHSLLASQQVYGFVFDSLYRVDERGRWEPALAAGEHVSADGLTWTYTLRPGVRWSDGEPLTSADVKYTWQLATDTGVHISYATGFDRIASVATPTPATVVFHLKAPYAPFREQVAAAPLCGALGGRDQPLTVQPETGGDGSVRGVGVRRRRSCDIAGESLLLGAQAEAAPDRRPHRARPEHPGQPSARGRPERAPGRAAGAARRSPPVPGYHAPAVSHVDLRARPAGRVSISARRAGAAGAGFRDAQGADHQGRHAGAGPPAVSDMVPDGPWADRGLAPRPYDPERARGLLRAAGFVRGADGSFTKDGARLEVPLWTVSTRLYFVQAMQIIAQAWRAAGVATDTHAVSSAALFGQNGPQWNGRDAALIFSWSQGVFPENRINWSSAYIPADANGAGENAERYRNPEMDALLDQADAAVDPARRLEIYRRIQALEQRDVPVIFLFWYVNTDAVAANVHGYVATTFGTTPPETWSTR